MTELNIEQARFNMVEQQIRTWDVLDQRVLDVLMTTPRELFVPERHRKLAFADLQIPLDQGQTMLEPKLEARILQALDPQPGDKALEIGTGSGYLTACLARMCAQVTSVDIFPEFTEQASARLKEHEIDNVELITADASKGPPRDERYDVILVSGSLPELHDGFHKALTIGGRLFLIVGETPIMEALLITRISDDQWSSESLLETVVAPLINAQKTRRFLV